MTQQPGQLTSFGRYSREAMKLLFSARAELARLGGDALLPEHLVLAMLKPESGGAYEALTALGCSLDAVREQIEARVARGAQPPDPGDLPLGPAMIAVLEHAHASAGQIGSRELLVSVLAEGRSSAAEVLQQNGVTAAALN